MSQHQRRSWAKAKTEWKSLLSRSQSWIKAKAELKQRQSWSKSKADPNPNLSLSSNWAIAKAEQKPKLSQRQSWPEAKRGSDMVAGWTGLLYNGLSKEANNPIPVKNIKFSLVKRQYSCLHSTSTPVLRGRNCDI